MRKAVLTTMIALTVAAPAVAAERWAGLTRAQAIDHAKRDVIAAALAFGTMTPTQAPAFRAKLDANPPTAARVTCRNGRPAWRIRWPSSNPVYLNSTRMLLGCR